MKIIGIITRKQMSSESHNINVIYTDIARAIIKNGGLPIGIILEEDYKEVIDFCDGIVFQGGDDFEIYDIDAMKYIYDIDKPVLGICLGMQIMGTLFDGKLIDIKGHKEKSNYVHDVIINKDSKLYRIFNTNIIKVNSRHKSAINNTSLFISGISDDGFIEAIEDQNKRFFIGVQWHPESMIKYDKFQNNIFEFFVKSID